ncbi:MAG: 50S ribosomal protein L20 [Candidatus Omnitrophota bacterium]
MTRVTYAVARQRRKKRLFKLAKGQRGGRSCLLRTASESTTRALAYAYIGRKHKKRQFRQLWITRLTAAVSEGGVSYSRFINGLKKAQVILNRKSLAELAVNHKAVFNKLLKLSQENLTKGN